MKKLLFTIIALFFVTIAVRALPYNQAQSEALYLTDKMAYELGLSEEQYDAAYEINLDYFLALETEADIAGTAWSRRNLDFSYVLSSSQFRLFSTTLYFYRPVEWLTSMFRFRIYDYYTNRRLFYFGLPSVFHTYKGGHSWVNNGNRSWYKGRKFSTKKVMTPAPRVVSGSPKTGTTNHSGAPSGSNNKPNSSSPNNKPSNSSPNNKPNNAGANNKPQTQSSSKPSTSTSKPNTQNSSKPNTSTQNPPTSTSKPSSTSTSKPSTSTSQPSSTSTSKPSTSTSKPSSTSTSKPSTSTSKPSSTSTSKPSTSTSKPSSTSTSKPSTSTSQSSSTSTSKPSTSTSKPSSTSASKPSTSTSKPSSSSSNASKPSSAGSKSSSGGNFGGKR